MTGIPSWLGPLVTRAAALATAEPAVVVDRAAAPRSSAVLVLFGESAARGPDVLLLQRAEGLRNHPGQVAFPGGGADPGDRDAAATALREANEEVGLDPTTAEVVGQLPTFWIPVSNYLVTPILAWWREPHPVHPVDPGEVARVDRLAVADLATPANRLRVRHPSGWVGPAFLVGDLLVWGFTAGVLATLIELGGWERPWSQHSTGRLPGPTGAAERLPDLRPPPVR